MEDNDHDVARLLGRVTVEEDGCWLWVGALNDGYANAKINGRATLVHRWLYEVLIEPVAQGFQLDHLCRNRHCVNVNHVEPVTKMVNMMRGVGVGAMNAAKVLCAHGHDDWRWYTRTDGRKYRDCRTCTRAAQNAWYKAKK